MTTQDRPAHDRLRIGVALDGAGWHHAAWREPSSRPGELFDAGYWADLVRLAEAGGLDFVTIDDSLSLQSATPFGADDRIDEVRGRLDAALIAARVAPVTSRIGLIPTVTTTHTEPFHVSTSIATLDFVSDGRAGWQPRVSIRPDESAHFGRRAFPVVTGTEDPALAALATELFGEASDAVDVVRRLWDSWEDDAEIRDAATDRFLDPAKVHRIDFEGRHFSVRGPSITPRPPQGQPVVAALAHATVPYEFAARSADVVFVTPHDAAHAAGILDEVAAAEAAVGRAGERLRVVADILVFLDGPHERGADRLARLDALGHALVSDTRIFAGSAAALADEIAVLAELGYDGVRLRPGVATDDLPRIAVDVVAAVAERGLFAVDTAETSLRARLGLPVDVPNRYAAFAV